jgi:hypothetical membrane protein
VGGGILVIGSLQWVASMIAVQLGYPGYSDSANYISDLGGPQSPYAWLFNASVRVLGVLGVLAVFAIRTAFPPRMTSRLGLLFLFVASIGAFLVGTFPEGSPQFGGNIHSIVSGVAFIGAGLSLLMLGPAMFRDTRWEGLRGYTLLSGVVTLVALALFEGNLFLGIGPGGMERLVVAPILLWSVIAGIHLFRLTTYAPAVVVKTAS